MKKIIHLNSLFILVSIIILSAWLLSSDMRMLLPNSLPKQALYLQPVNLWSDFITASEHLKEYVLPYKFSAEYAPFILASGLLSMLFLKLVSNLNIFYVGLWIVGAYQRWLKPTIESRIIAYFAALSLLILVVYIASRLFISSRYSVFLLLLAGLLVVRYVDILILKLQQRGQRKGLILIYVFMLILFLSGMISLGAKKTGIKSSSELAVQIVLGGERIACNEPRHLYYTRRKCEMSAELKDNYTADMGRQLYTEGYRYLLLWVKHSNAQMLDSLSNDNKLQLVQDFINKKGDQGLLYQITFQPAAAHSINSLSN